MTGLTRGKEATHLDHLPATLLDLARQEGQQFAKRSIRERARDTPVLEQPFEVEVFNANDPVTVGEPGGQLVEHIISHAGDAVVQSCHLSTRFLTVL